RVITTPRVLVRARWQRLTREMIESPANCSRMATAARAAATASSPCPTPSTTASSTPWSSGLTRCRSPETAWPSSGRAATPQSINGGWSAASLTSAQPFLHGDCGSFANLGIDVKLIHQPFGAGQADSQSLAGGIAVLHGQRHVRNTRAVVPSDQGDAVAVALLDGRQNNLSGLGMVDDVAGHFGDGGGDQGQVGSAEAQLHTQLAPLLAGRHDVRCTADGDPRLILH